MADIPPDADVTTERNHSRDGGEDQQQSAVLPPPPRHTPDSQVDAGVTATAIAPLAAEPGASGGANPPAPPPSEPADYSSSVGQLRPVDPRLAAVNAADTIPDSGDAGSPAYRDYHPPTCDPHTQHRRHSPPTPAPAACSNAATRGPDEGSLAAAPVTAAANARIEQFGRSCASLATRTQETSNVLAPTPLQLRF